MSTHTRLSSASRPNQKQPQPWLSCWAARCRSPKRSPALSPGTRPEPPTTTFWIFDTFASEDARQAHIGGPIAAMLMKRADDLFTLPPEILPADVLAAK